MIRRNAVLSLAGSLLALSSAARALTMDTVYRPLPYPCENHIDDCGPKPKPWNCFRQPCEDHPFKALTSMQGNVEVITGAVADGDLDAAAQGLGALFTGSQSGPAAVVPVGASIAPKPTPTNPGPDSGLESPRPVKKLLRSTLSGIEAPVYMGEAKDGIIPVTLGEAAAGAAIGIIIEKGVEKAGKAVEDYVNRDQTKESIEKYGGCRLKGMC